MPPPLALNLKVKYPDIYNRYRKLKGPIKASKPLRSRRALKRSRDGDGDGDEEDAEGKQTEEGVDQDQDQLQDQQFQGMELDVGISDDLARLASGHVDLAQALLRLPRGGQDGEQVHLDEAMLRMARMREGEGQDVKPVSWGINGMGTSGV